MLRPLKPAEFKRATVPPRFHARVASLPRRLHPGRLFSERLRPARGILLGIVISLVLWGFIAAALVRWLA